MKEEFPTYEEMLKEAYTRLPAVGIETSRFEPPKIQTQIQGNRTQILNVSQIADSLDRKREHIIKFFSRELASTSDMKDDSIFLGRFNQQFMEQKLTKYIDEFVLCKECKKPDTELIKKEGVTALRCKACGAARPVRTIK